MIIKKQWNNYRSFKRLSELEESEIDSLDKKSRLRFLRSLKKEEFFVRKWLVLPAYYLKNLLLPLLRRQSY